MPKTKAISELQRNMAAITRECRESKAPLYLTKNGEATLVIMDAAAFDQEMALHQEIYDREVRVQKAILRGFEDMQAGRTRTLSQARQDAARLRRPAHE